MNIEQSGVVCTGCQACVSICPRQCIQMHINEEGFMYPCVDNTACSDCSLCTQRCPTMHPVGKKRIVQESFQAVSKLSQRENSASGGFFYTAAKYIISQGGIVFGVGFDQRFRVQHMWVDTEHELFRLQGSKYVQSDVKDSYKQVKLFLQQGKKVLFSGTPCQIAGLYAVLGEDWKNLTTIDLICHGTPGTKLWDNYVSKRNQEKSIQSIRFRFKGPKDKSSYKLFFQYTDGTYRIVHAEEDIYFASFLKNESFRESCYSCQYASVPRFGDITIGDCATGVQYTKNDFKPFEAVSSVLINSEKGKNLWDSISNQLEWETLDLEKERLANRQLSKATARPKSRDIVFQQGDLHNLLQNKQVVIEHPIHGAQKLKQIIVDSLSIKARYRLKCLKIRKR